MMTQIYVLMVAGILMLGACMATPTAERSATSSSTATQSVPTDGLAPQTLNAGECGLFLWSRTPPSRFIFFTKAASGTATMLSGEEVRELRLTRQSGEIFGQFTTEQDFAFAADGSNVNLSVTPGEVLENGQRISEGRIVVRDAEGWETILPVLGVRACQAS